MVEFISATKLNNFFNAPYQGGEGSQRGRRFYNSFREGGK
jgi:hypothetical protein